MPTREVWREASRLAEQGYKQITLLGQNVNSYGKDLPAGDGNASFSDLLRKLNDIEGIELVSFTTSHPEDATEELFRAIRDSKKVSRRFHLPLQSGSNAMLKRMKRLHTLEEFVTKVELLRSLVPDIVLTTDIIVGFSNESELDFEATKEAMNRIRFEGAFIFKYSPRPLTPAFKLADNVPLPVKEARNRELLLLQERITRQAHEKLLGRTVEVLVGGRSRKNPSSLIGQTRAEQSVIFEGPTEWIGTVQKVVIHSRYHKTLIGRLLFEPDSALARSLPCRSE
jgi:tRNA-2-methylthio-N6-dimethylallyladenosine synthase